MITIYDNAYPPQQAVAHLAMVVKIVNGKYRVEWDVSLDESPLSPSYDNTYRRVYNFLETAKGFVVRGVEGVNCD